MTEMPVLGGVVVGALRREGRLIGLVIKARDGQLWHTGPPSLSSVEEGDRV